MPSRLAHSWASIIRPPKPPEFSCRISMALIASSGVPMIAPPVSNRAFGRLGGAGQDGLQRVAEVVDLPGAPALAGFGEGLLAGLGDVHRDDQTPLVAVDHLTFALGDLLNLRPLAFEVGASRQVGRRRC